MPSSKYAVLALFMFAPHAALANTLTDENKKLVVDFYTTAFVEHRPSEAADRYIGDIYIQHNSHVPNGPAAFKNYFEHFFTQNKNASSIIKHIIADGDLVAIHSFAQTNTQDQGKAIVDLFRVMDKKIVEHWDVIQDVPTGSVNGNSMFDGDHMK